MNYIFSVKEMRECDRKAIIDHSIPGMILMENAARFCSETILKYSYKDIIVICGPGNNGGDGYALARQLYSKGKNIRVLFFEIPKSKTDGYKNYRICKKLGISIKKIDNNLLMEELRKTIIVDGIFGTGLSRSIKGMYKKVIKWMNLNKKDGNLIFSIDIPSGLSGETGEILGDCIDSDVVCSFGGTKKGFYQNYGVNFLDKIIVDPISIPPEIRTTNTMLFEKPIIKKRKRNLNKYDFGKIGILGGSATYPGAPDIASYAALKSGSGMVYRITPDIIQNRPLSPEIIPIYFHSTRGYFSEKLSKANYEFIKKLDVLIIGPGLGAFDWKDTLIADILSNYKGKLVIDADGIAPFFSYLKNNKLKQECLITPHLGEFKKIATKLDSDIIRSLRVFTKKYYIPTLLKSGLAYFSFGDDKVFISDRGNPFMAKAGTGDGLSGIIGSFWGQGSYSLFDAVNISTYLMGKTAENLSEAGHKLDMSAITIIDNIYRTVNDIYEK